MAKSKILGTLKEIVPALAAALGPCYEVVLHDFSDLEHSIVAIAGNITGRSPGGSITDVVLGELKKGNTRDLIGYPNTLNDGRLLKSSTIFIRDDDGSPLGCLCINLDCTALVGAEKAIRRLTETRCLAESGRGESFVNDVAQLAATMINRAVESIPKPVALMTRQEKMQIVEMLEQQGLFMIKGGLEAVASALSLSRATIYTYQEELRGRRLSESEDRA
ncbi:MAG: transcriptional regulator [Ignavibacteriales bacterium]